MTEPNAPSPELVLDRGGRGKTTSTVNLTAELLGDKTILDIDSTSAVPGWRINADEFLQLVADLTALVPDPITDPVIGAMVDARNQATAHAREALKAYRALSNDELEQLGPGQSLFQWVTSLEDALSDEPHDYISGDPIAADDAGGRLEAIEESARELGDRSTASARELAGDSPASRRLLDALAAVTQVRAGFEVLDAATRAGLRRRGELTVGQ
ncbi:hypothetical protein ACFY4C_37330 [Actinomadura viridis]|uniref:hypothetical protein n=1 Tax=Actinomadura viridis TaxID=58110 RepID=UPI003681F8A1